jgi:hypothetical protein
MKTTLKNKTNIPYPVKSTVHMTYFLSNKEFLL